MPKRKEKSLLPVVVVVFVLILAGVFVVLRRTTQTEPKIVLPTPIALETITTKKWLWHYTMAGDEIIAKPHDPRRLFTITLAADGKVSVTTDCNNAAGSYTIDTETNALHFSPFAMTLKFCEASQEATFISQLDQVTSFSYRNDTLYLNLKDEAGRMEFGLSEK